MEEEAIKVSKYSSGVNIVIRLNDLWIKTHEYALHGKYQAWNTTLDRIWLELARDLKEKGDTTKDLKTFNDCNKEFKQYDKKIMEEGTFEDTNKQGFKKISDEDIKKRNKHYEILMEKQLFLTRLENKLGKGTTFADDDDDDL